MVFNSGMLASKYVIKAKIIQIQFRIKITIFQKYDKYQF